MDPPLGAWIDGKDPSELVVITYHVWFPYPGDPFYLANTEEIIARTQFQGVGAVPSIRMDGPHVSASNPSGYESLFDQRRGLPSPVSLELLGSFDETTGAGTVTVRVTPDAPLDGDWRLLVALTETDILYEAPNGIDVHEDIFRRFVPGTDADPIAFAGAGDPPIVVTAPFEVDAAWNTPNVKLVAMVQNLATREIAQGATVRVVDLMAPVPVTGTTWGRLKQLF